MFWSTQSLPRPNQSLKTQQWLLLLAAPVRPPAHASGGPFLEFKCQPLLYREARARTGLPRTRRPCFARHSPNQQQCRVYAASPEPAGHSKRNRRCPTEAVSIFSQDSTVVTPRKHRLLTRDAFQMPGVSGTTLQNRRVISSSQQVPTSKSSEILPQARRLTL